MQVLGYRGCDVYSTWNSARVFLYNNLKLVAWKLIVAIGKKIISN